MTLIRVLRAFPIVAAASLLAAPALAADLNGVWKGDLLDPSWTKMPISLELKDDQGKISGVMTGGPPTGEAAPIADAKLVNDVLTFDVRVPGPGGQEIAIPYRGTVAGDSIKGVQSSPMGELPWQVQRK